MPVAFAICFFLVVALSETLRHGVFGMSPSEISVISHACLALAALIILRSDLVLICRRPAHALYGYAGLNWTLPRTALGLILGTLIVILPVIVGVTLIQIKPAPVASVQLANAYLYEVFMVALSTELFFREAVVKAFSAHVGALIAASVLAYFVFHLPNGLANAVIAGAAGLYFAVLRVTGTNIIAIVIVSAAFSLAVAQVVLPQIPTSEIWTYAIYFTVASAVLSLIVVSVLRPNQKELSYA